MFVSFKLRNGEWQQNGRLFNGYDQDALRELLKNQPSLSLCSKLDFG